MLLHLLHFVAIVAKAMSGALMGMRRSMDRFGFCPVGSVTALGGGTVRDLLPGHYSLARISHQDYVLFTIGAASVAAAGAITGLSGGMLRDLLCNQIPLVLCKELYACIALGAGAPYVALLACGIAPNRLRSWCWPAVSLVHMMTGRFRWQLKVFTAADSGGAS